MADDTEIKYSDFIKKDGSFDELIAKLLIIRRELRETAKVAQKEFNIVSPGDSAQVNKLSKEVQALVLANKTLEKQIKLLTKAKKQRKKLTDEELIQAQKEKLTQRERIQRAKQIAIIEKEQGDTIKSLRAQLSLTSVAWAKLTDKEIQNSAAAKKLSKRKLDLTNQLKRLEKQTGDTRRNVGNYTDSLSKLGKTTARVFLGRSAVDFLRRLATGLKTLIDNNKDASKSIGELDGSLNRFTSGLTTVAVTILEFVAPTLIFLLDTGLSLLGLFFDLSEGVGEFVATSGELTKKTTELNDEFKKEKATADSLFFSLGKVTKGSKEHKEIVDKINTQYGEYLPNLLTEKSSLEEIAAAQETVNAALSKTFLLRAQQATQLDIFTNKANKTVDVFNNLKEAIEAEPLLDLNLSLNEFEDFVNVLGKSEGALQSFRKVLDQGDISNLTLSSKPSINIKADGTIDFLPPEDTGQNTLELAKKGLGDFANALAFVQNSNESTRNSFFDLIKETGQYNEAIDKTNSDIKSLQESLVTYDHELGTSTGRTKENSKALEDNIAARLAAIEALQNELNQVEAGNIQDRQERALRLEQLRFETLQQQRKLNFITLQELLKGQDEELKDVEKLNQRLSEEQLTEHENKKIEIIESFATKKKDIVIEAAEEEVNEQDKLNDETIRNSIGLLSDRQVKERAFQRKLEDQQLKAIGDKNKRQEQAELLSYKRRREDILSNEKLTLSQRKELLVAFEKEYQNFLQDAQQKPVDELIKNISKSTQKVGEIITKLFQDQADLSAKNVTEQEDNLSRARDRAEKGFESNIAFEEKELAKRQSEQLKRQKEQEQAAKILTLLNLVGAYAQSGDKNALARGFVDFALLEAFSSGIQGFYEGTENVEASLGSGAKMFSGVDAYLGVTNSGKMLRFDGQERIFNAAQNMALGYMSNDEAVTNALIGSQISDYNDPFNPVNQNLYEKHKSNLKESISTTVIVNDNSQVVQELRSLNKRIASQASNQIDVEKIYRNIYGIIKTEVREGLKRTGKKGRL